MAGTSIPNLAPYPNGNVLLQLGPVSADGSGGGAYKIHSSVKVPFDLNIVRAWIVCREGGFTDADASMFLKIVDDSDSAQTIVAEFGLTTSFDTGLPIELTVADHGPVLAGGIVELCIKDNTSDVMKDVSVWLECEPKWSRPKATEY